jgi:hypothetical protein
MEQTLCKTTAGAIQLPVTERILERYPGTGLDHSRRSFNIADERVMEA